MAPHLHRSFPGGQIQLISKPVACDQSPASLILEWAETSLAQQLQKGMFSPSYHSALRERSYGNWLGNWMGQRGVFLSVHLELRKSEANSERSKLASHFCADPQAVCVPHSVRLTTLPHTKARPIWSAPNWPRVFVLTHKHFVCLTPFVSPR